MAQLYSKLGLIDKICNRQYKLKANIPIVKIPNSQVKNRQNHK